MRKSLLILLLLTVSVQSVWAGCYIEIGTDASSSGVSNANINIPGATQTPLPNSSDLMVSTKNSTFTYWIKQNGSVRADDAATLKFPPSGGSTFTVDSSNPKGWLADPSIPGLYFTLAANLPNPPAGFFTSWNKTTIYMSNDTSVSHATATGWGCTNTSENKAGNGTVTFTLSFYTTSAFDPAKASGKKLFTTPVLAGSLENLDNSKGGQVEVYIYGPLTIATTGCAAFRADSETVNLGEVKLSELKQIPYPPYNDTPFNIRLENCYGSPSLVINFSGNQVKKISGTSITTLVNTQGSARGVGVALEYLTEMGGYDVAFDLDLSTANTVPAKYLNYTSGNGNGTLRMNAQLYVNDVDALSPGTIYIPAVMTITQP